MIGAVYRTLEVIVQHRYVRSRHSDCCGKYSVPVC